MKKQLRKCPKCKSKFVCWNWFSGENKWAHECWDCGDCFQTLKKVTNGITHDELKKTFVRLPKHELRDLVEEMEYMFFSGYNMWKTEYYRKHVTKITTEIERLLLDQLKNNKEEIT